MSLRNYLALFQENIQKLEDYGYTEFIEIREEIRPNKQAIINRKISFVDGSVLHIKEYIIEACLPDISEVIDEVIECF